MHISILLIIFILCTDIWSTEILPKHHFKSEVCWSKVGILLVLNQACVGHRPVQAWFLEVALVCASVCVCVCVSVCVCVCVCVAPKGINNQWYDIDHV